MLERGNDKPLMVGAVLDSGSGVACILELLARTMEKGSQSTQVTYVSPVNNQANETDGTTLPLPLRQRTGQLKVTLSLRHGRMLSCAPGNRFR